MSEYQIHKQIYLKVAQLIHGRGIIFHIPNQRSNGSAKEWAALSQMGAIAGMPDLMVIVAGKVMGIEVKGPTGKLSDAQVRVHAHLEKVGCPVVVCKSADEAVDAVKGIVNAQTETQTETCK